MVTINLFEIEDECETNWWEMIRTSSDFAYFSKIPDLEKVNVEDDDILIHKCMDENENTGARFVKKIHYQILDGEPYLITLKDSQEMMALQVEEFIKTNQKMPYSMQLKKMFRGKKQPYIEFKLNNYDSYHLKLNPVNLGIGDNFKTLDLIEIETFIKDLPNAEKPDNILESETSANNTYTVKKLASAPTVQTVAGETGGKVFIDEAEIISIDRRSSKFQEHETIFYILQVDKGKVSATGKKSDLWRDFETINVKSSEKAMETYQLEVGNKIKFTGKFMNHKIFGPVIQNIRKFTKIDK